MESGWWKYDQRQDCEEEEEDSNEYSKQEVFFFMIADAVGSHLKVLIRQVDLQAKRVDTLGQRPGHKICQGVRGLTKPGQHVLH